MTVLTCAPEFGDGDDDPAGLLVRFALDMKDYLIETCDQMADEDEALRADLRLVVEMLWV